MRDYNLLNAVEEILDKEKDSSDSILSSETDEEIILDDKDIDSPEIRKWEANIKSFGKTVLFWLIFFLAVQVLFRILLLNAYVPSSSMEPTLYPGDLCIGTRMKFWNGNQAEPGDIMIFWCEEENSHLVKRVIGVGGDTMKIKDGKVYRNGEKLDESYIMPGSTTYKGSLLDDEIVVPDGHYFVMGDNRENSRDSRFLSVTFIPQEDAKAVVLFRYWPVQNFKIFNLEN